MIGEFVMELAAASTDVEGCLAAARRLDGRVYSDQREGAEGLPFRALLTAVTDDLDAVAGVADVGCYVVCRRQMKAGTSAVIALFPLLRRPDLSHRSADAHWRDVHAPLALEHHGFMSSYAQLSVVHPISGLAFDGFALCGFDSEEDLRQRFYSGPQSRDVIAADILKMADIAHSPRRLIATETNFATTRRIPDSA